MPPPRRGSRAPWLIAGLVAVGAVVLVVVLVAGGGDGGGGSGGSAETADLEAAVERFVEADSCSALAEATTASWQLAYLGRYVPPEGAAPAGTFAEACQQVQSEGVTPIATGEDEMQQAEVVSQDGDVAVVRATSVVSGQELSSEYTLALEDGTWKVDQVGSGSGDGESAVSLPTIPEGDTAGSVPAEGSLAPGAREDPNAPGGVAAEPDANGDLPEDVVANFFEAANTGDCELAVASVSEAAWTEYFGAGSEEEALAQCQAQPGSSGTTLESAEFAGILLEPSADMQAEGMQPNTAIVEVVASDGEESVMWLIFEDGYWKIY